MYVARGVHLWTYGLLVLDRVSIIFVAEGVDL